MANNLTDLNIHLFNQLERLSNKDLKGEELSSEIQRANSITSISKSITESAKLTLESAKLISSGTIISSGLPEVIGMKNAKQLS